MERILINELQKWKEKSDRKPLILRGARQVGKTWLLKDFGKKSFKDVCYINFEQKDVLGAIFEGTLSPKRIIEQLSVYSGKKILPEETLIIFDEVQEMPRALTSLKYFAEEAPEYAICCAGSLLGVALHEGTSFPVGKVEFLDLYPLSFREFLLANGEEMLLDYILKDGNRDLAAFTEKLTDYLKKYFVIGGMPSAILKWLDTHNFFEVDDVQKQLVAAYENDFSKHTPKTNDRENKICVGQHTLLDGKRIRDASIYTLKNIAQVLSIFNLLRYLTDLNDIPLIIADRVL